jgi:hypothetical protein
MRLFKVIEDFETLYRAKFKAGELLMGPSIDGSSCLDILTRSRNSNINNKELLEVTKSLNKLEKIIYGIEDDN